MTPAAAQPGTGRLPAYGAFAAPLAAAGLPVYLPAPRFYAGENGVSLAHLGAALFALRLIDVVQDPLLGRLADRLRRHRAMAAGRRLRDTLARRLLPVAFLNAAPDMAGPLLLVFFLPASCAAPLWSRLAEAHGARPVRTSRCCRRMADIAPSAADGFGLWSFMAKLTPAFAAVLLLPALQSAGFRPGTQNSAAACSC